MAVQVEHQAGRQRRLKSLRLSTIAVIVGLVAQWAIGIVVNITVAVPAGAKGAGVGPAIGKALTQGTPALAFHVALGLALVLGAIAVVAQAVLVRRRGAVVASVVGIVAIIGAAVAGSRFVATSANPASLAMALLALVALAAYVFLIRGLTGGEAVHGG
ncbi:MAG: hypothetical protein ACRDY2_06130 [Acidimicrobiales bacterium]